ncbi:beta-galactosidase [Paenibacillus sp. B01]|uniref:beta-galactosidase n=1 Tax=Paenibacillus sp. B01 TaxID=2660554 RepID=UPI0018918C6E|nr:beta-galactosidase [Paenibacillus sp. B01]
MMKSPALAAAPVSLAANEVRIQGKSELLLCASLFYFRIPRALWRERMLQLKAFGYNAIDVYFPWNYHEPEEGQWDFAGEKDVRAFLQEAHETGLFVVARPGPYICSEWDGGALPAYLSAVEGMRLRDNDPLFLAATAKWFDRILPVLKAYEIGSGGTIVAVQLDNELDFYGCKDPRGYISALREMALERGIAVPLIACAGQGGLMEASGFADGVVPTCNFYPNDRDRAFEEKVGRYQELLAGKGLPLLVTETNRSHFLLRRLLSCGAKLLGPYLQVSGTDFGFTNATNNWGKPLAFLTSDYDFGGMISPEGHIRPEAYEGRLLGRLMAAYGATLAEAAPAEQGTMRTLAAPEGAAAGSRALKLRDGGYLGFVSNVTEETAAVVLEIAGTRIPQRSTLRLERWRSLALPVGVPLRAWGIEGTLLHATAELWSCRKLGSKTVLAFHAEGQGEIVLNIEGATVLETSGMDADEAAGALMLTFDSSEDAACRIALPDGSVLELIAMDRSRALLLEEIGEGGELRFGEMPDHRKEAVELDIPWTFSPVEADRPLSTSRRHGFSAGGAGYLESYGIQRGYGWYVAETEPPQAAEPQGLLVRNGSDVLSLYAGKRYLATIVPGGSSRYVPFADPATDGPIPIPITVRAEIWGHSNFDDIRLPGLRLHAGKGLTGLATVTKVIPLTGNWRVKAATDREPKEEWIGRTADEALWPIVSFGGWLSSARPALEYYRNRFQAAGDANCWTLHFDGLQASVHVFVDGKDAGPVHPGDPYVDLSAFVQPGEPVQLAVFMDRQPGPAAGKVTLYEGVAANRWEIFSGEEEQLHAHAQSLQEAASVRLPVQLEAGDMGWLIGAVGHSNGGKGWRVQAKGSNLKLTALFNGRLVGRIWLQGSRSRPFFTGGSQDSFYVPGPWFREEAGQLALLLEAVDGEAPSVLEELSFRPV